MDGPWTSAERDFWVSGMSEGFTRAGYEKEDSLAFIAVINIYFFCSFWLVHLSWGARHFRHRVTPSHCPRAFCGSCNAHTHANIRVGGNFSYVWKKEVYFFEESSHPLHLTWTVITQRNNCPSQICQSTSLPFIWVHANLPGDALKGHWGCRLTDSGLTNVFGVEKVTFFRVWTERWKRSTTNLCVCSFRSFYLTSLLCWGKEG